MPAHLVSIILPVYNGEKYLTSAIDSVLAQSYSDWELLVVDDGSVDGSAAISDGFSSKDSRITVYHQPNGGVNSARAKGVDSAKGDYLVFLDADDRLSPDALEYWVVNFRDTDDLIATWDKESEIGRDDYLVELWKGGIGPELWGKMFRMSKYRQMDYSIDRRMAMGEDLFLNSIYALSVNQVRTLPRKVYLVNSNNDASVTRTFKHNWEYEKYYFDVVEEQFLKKCAELGCYDRIRLLVNKSWLNAMKYVMLDGGSVNYKDPEFKSVRDYFKDRKTQLGPSEKLIFCVRNPRLYRMILKVYLAIKKHI